MIFFFTACAISSPFDGPGLDDDGIPTSEGPFIVAVTHARPAKGEGAAFDEHVDAIKGQLEDSDGLVAYSLRGELGGRDRWTVSIWESEEAMGNFMISGAHLEAMADATTVIEEMATAMYVEDDPTMVPPRWSEALTHLE